MASAPVWWPCLLTDWDKMSNLYNWGLSIDASYQVSVHLAKRFQRRRFLKIGQSETRIACAPVWWPCLLMDRDKMCNLYRGPSIDASYQVSVHMAEGFQRRRLKCEKLTDDRWRTTDAKWWQNLILPLARWAKRYTPNQLYWSDGLLHLSDSSFPHFWNSDHFIQQ
jgi:hypothetical protein